MAGEVSDFPQWDPIAQPIYTVASGVGRRATGAAAASDSTVSTVCEKDVIRRQQAAIVVQRTS